MTTYRLRADVLEWQVVEEELVVADLHGSRYLGLNATGAALWQELEHGASKRALIDVLVESFRVSADRASADVDEFLDVLRERDLLVEN